MPDTSLDSSHFYFLVAVLQGFILAVLIIVRKPVITTNVFFGIIVLLFSLSLLHGVLEQSIHAFNARFLFPMEYGFLLGPLCYFHFRQIATPALVLQRRDLLHFIPSLLLDVALYLITFSYIRSNLEWAEAHVAEIQITFLIVALFFIVHVCVYAAVAYRMIGKSEIRPRENAADIQKWSMIFFSLWMVAILVEALVVVSAILNIDIFATNDNLIYNPMGIIKAICIYTLGYWYLIKYHSLLVRHSKSFDRTIVSKYSADEIHQKQQQLHAALEESELYKDEKLTVEKLAKHLGWPARDLSGIIAEQFDLNFNDFVNRYRVRAFKLMAEKPENHKYSIMGLAEKAGFNSKASFYRAFKKECGQTPSEFFAASKTP
jgi:AraC-like DNA-binding protein